MAISGVSLSEEELQALIRGARGLRALKMPVSTFGLLG